MSESPNGDRSNLNDHINLNGGDGQPPNPDPPDAPEDLDEWSKEAIYEAFASELEERCRFQREARTLRETLRRKGIDPPAPTEYEAFPVDALPETAREYVTAASEALPTAPAFVAVPMLSVLAFGVGSAARLQLKESWTEPATLWTALVAPSGSTKSPAFRHAIRPVIRHENEALRAYEDALDRWDPDSDEPKPERSRYRTGDTTPEAVVRILQNNPRGILLARDELAAWIGSFDRYANGAAELQFWIEVWNGIQVSKDRAGDGNITVPNPAVPLTGTIQPGTLKEKITKLHFQSGFVSRLVLSMPPVKPKEWTEADVTKDLQDRYGDLLRTLYSLHEPENGPRTVTLGHEAKRRWIRFYNEENDRIHTLPEGATRSARVKGITNAARIALLLHLCRVAEGTREPGPVDRDTLEDALTIANWTTRETLRVYGELELGTEALDPHERFFRHLPHEFPTREAKRIAEEEGVPERTLYDWLNRLQDDGKLEKIRRGRYRKK
jgi:hypothetical protein